MSDDATQAPGADTPAVDADTPQVDWEKRYNDLQPEYTRKSQRLSQLESDPDATLEWIQQHHPDLFADAEEEDPGQGYEEEDDDPRWSKLQELETWKAEQEKKQQAQQFNEDWAGWESHVKQLAQAEGVELTTRDIKALKVDSVDKNGWPLGPEDAAKVLKESIAELHAYEESLLERARKNRKRVPLPPGDGKTATQTPNLDNEQERIAHMTQQYMAREADS